MRRFENIYGWKMSEILTSAQMRAVEEAAISSGAVSGLELMERAGRGVVEAIFEHWPELETTPGTASVLCGPGNNGGDGFVVARLLEAMGWQVDCYLYGTANPLPPDARTNCDRWPKDRPAPSRTGLLKTCRTGPGRTDSLFIDAVFGIGLTRPLADDLRGVFAAQSGGRLARHCVAIDIPSGLDADSGRMLRPEGPAEPDAPGCVADLTVTFHAPKPGHLLAEGPRHCGRLVVKSIGLAPAGKTGAPLQQIGPDTLSAHQLDKRESGHKYTHGHALVLSGGPGKGGAARLAARAALRVGAGLVTLACPEAALAENAARLTAVMLAPLSDPAALGDLLVDARLNALCLGPGLGQDAARALVPVALASRRATVLDADALSAFADDPAQLFARLHAGAVLTPHMGEFRRLFPDLAKRLRAPPLRGPAVSRLDAVRAAARRAGCTVLLKGPDTVIADETGAAAIHSATGTGAAPWLATAGSGDVLAGLITGLLARGFAPFEAAGTGTVLHVQCARQFGPGLISEDLPEQLPAVFRTLGL